MNDAELKLLLELLNKFADELSEEKLMDRVRKIEEVIYITNERISIAEVQE